VLLNKETNYLKGKGIVQISCGFDHTLAVDNKGVVYSWGYGGNGKLGHGSHEESVHLPTVIEVCFTSISKIAISHHV